MSDKRRAEIEAKRAKLAELRKARADRQRAETERRQQNGARRDVDDLVNQLVGSRSGLDTGGDITPSSSLPNTPPRPDVGSDKDRVSMGTTMVGMMEHVDRVLTPRFIPDLIDVEQELFELPQRERVIYNKEVQTTAIETETPRVSEDEIRQQIMLERELEAERIAQDKELEEKFPGLCGTIVKIVQRALNDGYDYIRDYTIGTEANGDDSEGKRVKRICAFYDERYGKNRSITDIDWSPKYPELSVASYNKNPAALNEPDGIVAVWNLHLLDRPEFVFHSQSDVLSVTFSPFHSNLVFGGTYSGQILLWDTRSKHLPVLKTPLSAAGHTHPVYAMQMVGTQNAHNLITSSTDGTVCSWLVDMLAQPQETLELIHAGHNKTGEVAITTLDFPDNETTTFWVGTEEGNVYQANRYDRAGAKAGLNQYDIYKGHAGPVMGLHFHPLVGPVDFSDLFLTASVDWTADDYVYDVKWHPAHPALFGTVDGSGRFDVWNLNTDTEVPIVSTNVGSGRAINKLQWDRNGRRAALGGSDGKLYVYDIGDMALPRESEWTDLQKTVAGFIGGSQGNGVVDGDATRIVAGR
ncbi:WD40-repeat-containing domain protein [Suillus bovinus]|uniref:WD40-repeat-containing domain protein n=1 Tax=Suillus bovinus TaxID=48563 RepID=UPI001B87BF9B|nr:WD40-repeat-containing domain protein [Suillus bovinus]KAG2129234.1 WD40-repeat-containing domain protein [Suillus bovinus]